MYASIHMCVYMCIYICMCIYIYMHVYIYMCRYVYIDIHIHMMELSWDSETSSGCPGMLIRTFASSVFQGGRGRACETVHVVDSA